MTHFRHHRQDGKHDGNIIDNGRNHPNQDIGCGRAEITIQQLRAQTQITDGAKSTDTENDAVEEHQGIPFGAFNLIENIEWLFVIAHFFQLQYQLRFSKFESITIDLEETKTGHHAHHRWQMQEIMRTYRHGNGQQEQTDNDKGPFLEFSLVA